VTRRTLVVIAYLLLLALARTGCGQVATTSLRGLVKDPTGAVIPGATITLSSDANGQRYNTISNASGEYAFAQIAPAKYTIGVTAKGFGGQTKVAELLVNQPATIDFTMTVKTVAEVVNVSAEAQTLNTTDSSLGNSMNNAQILSLPSEGRSVPDLLALQPGVLYLGQLSGRASNPSDQNDPRSGAVNGGRSDQGNITVDGIDDNDQVNGYAFTGVLRETQDSVEEFRVTTGNASADAGRSSGAQVNMVTKAGTNKFHGSAYEYNRPTVTVSNDWFNKQAQLSSAEANRPPKLIRNNFGGSVGGPILRDRLFFFGNYEGLRQAENQIVSRTTPTALYQAGTLQYIGDNPDGSQSIAALTAAQVTQLDSGCEICGTAAYTAGPGPNPNALAYFNSEPAANGTTLGDGLNTGSFTFASPSPVSQNTSIGRIDFTLGQEHHIFVRGNLQKDTVGGVEQFPGQGPSFILKDNSKGITAGDSWTLLASLVNDLRYGYIRQGYGNTGVASGTYVDFRFIDTETAETRSTIVSVPVNNIVDNLSWTKGTHALQAGANWRLVHYNHGTDSNSFDLPNSNPYWLGGSPPNPTTIGGLPVDIGFANSYEIAFANLVGTIPEVTNIYNYRISSANGGALLRTGAFITHHFKANEVEYYLQDSWRLTPKLTLTYGVRHTLLQTPYEDSGQEIAPTIDTHTWFQERETAAQRGQVYEPNLYFAPAGPAFNKSGYWPKQKLNIAPRFSVAWAPDSRTSIRSGFGIFYDHYGEGLVSTFDEYGSFGLSSRLENPAGVYGIEGDSSHLPSPRFINRRTIPPIGISIGSNTTTFPYEPPSGLQGFAITWGLDSRLKTPYSESFDLSAQRELPAGFTLEAAYYGRLGRHLIQSLDLAEPVDLVDTKGGGDYYAAGTQLSRLVDQNGGNASAAVPAIRYFEDIFPFMAGVDYPGESATQAIYTNEWAPYRAQNGATTPLADIDFYCNYGCPAGYQSQFWQGQFSSLYALSTDGNSYYNAGQLILRHPIGNGLRLDFSYSLSKSIDMGSDVERGSEFNEIPGIQGGGSISSILNTWRPQLNRGPSDFDTRHLVTGEWVYDLPFGNGRRFAGGVGKTVDSLIGGWQWTGVERWTSGLPFSLLEPGWTTDWQVESFGVVTGKVAMHRHFDENGNPEVFANPTAINSGVATGFPVRLPYPGEAGERNNFRGDGYFSTDSGIDKSLRLREYGTLKFAWEVFNATNTVRFDPSPSSLGNGLTGGNLGVYGSMLTTPRRMQFSLRYDF